MKKTPLNRIHRQMGARMVDFAGWEMPVQYQGPIQEHLAVRSAAGLFDVSHMGEIEIRGPGALALLQKLISNDASTLQ
ncbi:MAG: glycine cleavage system aminomethyltransferase GcvT, partial [Acidobacteria bacterium]|nr:glycine cleavage system aminomethyltransferase GcvT [Acidobacteriota bacterium]